MRIDTLTSPYPFPLQTIQRRNKTGVYSGNVYFSMIRLLTSQYRGIQSYQPRDIVSPILSFTGFIAEVYGDVQSRPFVMSYAFIGTWKLAESENFGEFLKELGVTYIMRKFAETAKPIITFSLDGDRWTMQQSTVIRTTCATFRMGEVFVERRLDGVNVRTVVYMDGSKMIQRHFADPSENLKEVLIVREILNNQMVVKATVGGVTCIRKYNKRR
ncbi:fatty acid-binding protein5 isoform 1 [Tropilaelaps mercedesae]|uniref:Fatty acid-binding protein5 isoform 1 n=1 Tax=Tropilaelaps mercedesae TaxID=418985 RepID=A0A1V9X669_9ACAR|nr:fatty acid-binding protein5 isoform 1 [Tropilaelaps mercedesae]